MRCKTIHV